MLQFSTWPLNFHIKRAVASNWSEKLVAAGAVHGPLGGALGLEPRAECAKTPGRAESSLVDPEISEGSFQFHSRDPDLSRPPETQDGLS